MEYLDRVQEMQPGPLRVETLRRIEAITARPIICYVSRGSAPAGVSLAIDDSDLGAFSDLLLDVEGDEIDVLIVSNGGIAESTERIVRLLRDRFTHIRFIVPSNAFSAATLLCLAGDAIIMSVEGTLGPIDPQLGGVPARAILRAFEHVEQRILEDGPRAISAYLPMLEKYDLHLLEMCKSAEELSKELASNWLSKYMLKCTEDDPRIKDIVQFFSSYDIHKSHGRSIDRGTARNLGLNIIYVEEIPGLASLLRSLFIQYTFLLDRTPFYKLFDNTHGVNWGRQISPLFVRPPPPLQTPPPGPAEPSNQI